MSTLTSIKIQRRQLLQVAVLSALYPSAIQAAGPCRGEQPAPPGDLPRSKFGEKSTAEEVTEGLDLSGKTALVTGCNSGLGMETMRVLTMRGAHVIGSARTMEKAEKACANFAGKTTPVVAELSDFHSVVSCTEVVKALNKPIDMLICNAGIMALPDLRKAYGLELQFVVNHLGHFVLVNGLLDQVKAAGNGRIVMLSSCAHFSAPPVGIDFDNLDGARSYEAWAAYGRSKLANGLFALELSKRLAGTGVTANSLHPGVIRTNLGRHLDNQREADDDVYNKNIAQGAATQCYVAAHPIPAGISGQYFSDCNPAQANPLMYDTELAARLWSTSENLVSKVLG
jgi:NAD(P)-dependent dehydrogenase (short-subunit alcohol dehydrogenase family)